MRHYMILLALLLSPLAHAGSPTIWGVSGGASAAQVIASQLCFLDGSCMNTSASGGGITALTGDVTASGTGSVVSTIAANAVTNAKAAQMATHTIKGNSTGSTANAADLTATAVTALLNAVVGDSGSGGTQGMVPAPSAGDAAAGKFLKADGTFAVPPTGSSYTFSSPLVNTAGTVSCNVSSGSQAGCLASADWTTFNGKAGLAQNNTFTAYQTNSTAGVASHGAQTYTGAPYAAGSATTNKPQVLIETSGATSTGWSGAGTELGVNAASAFAGNLLDLQQNGVSTLNVSNGQVGIGGPQGSGYPLEITSVSNLNHQMCSSSAQTSCTDILQEAAEWAMKWDGNNVFSMSCDNASNCAFGALSNDDARIDIFGGSSKAGLVITNGPSTPGDLTDWESNGGAVLAKVDSSGNITGVNYVGTGTTFTMASIGSVTPNTAACFSSGGVLGTDAANCIASLRAYKQDIVPMHGPDALETVNKLAEAAVYYRYTDKYLGVAKKNAHARDRQPGFIADDVEKIDARYASYNGKKLRGVRYEQLAATEAVAIKELTQQIADLRAEIAELKGSR